MNKKIYSEYSTNTQQIKPSPISANCTLIKIFYIIICYPASEKGLRNLLALCPFKMKTQKRKVCPRCLPSGHPLPDAQSQDRTVHQVVVASWEHLQTKNRLQYKVI
jgi:hypothetical protein